MAKRHWLVQVRRVYEFGPFRLETRPHLLLRAGKVVRLTPKALETLVVLVENRGRVMERDELLRAVWPDTFVEEKNLTQNISVLRKTLDQPGAGIPYIETLPKRGYRFVAEVAEREAALPPRAGRRRAAAALFAAAAGLAAVVAGWFALRSPKTAPELILTQLTTDTGLTCRPAVSPDGKLLAYASDRAGRGDLDLWVRQLPGGEPIRLTDHEADDSEPAFSPDGAMIAFHSLREGGGIYVIPSLGGAPKRIAAGGRRPRFSPDGRWIAYWVAGGGMAVYTVASDGGTPRRITPEGVRAETPIWSPDGKHLLFTADFRGERAPDYDWWVVPLAGGKPTPVGALEVFLRRGMRGALGEGLIAAEEWIVGGNQVVFSARRGDTTNLWTAPISTANWKLAGEPQPLTLGAGFIPTASASSGGLLVFANLVRNLDIWELAISGDGSQPAANPRQLTLDAAADLAPSISSDGMRLVFESTRAGNRQVWKQELPGGRPSPLTDTPSFANVPKISPDGSMVAYAVSNWGPPRSSAEINVVPFAGGVPRKICDRCVVPWDWSAGGDHILSGFIRSRHLSLVDIHSGAGRRLVEHPDWELWSGDLSPDNRWLAFRALRGPGLPNQLFLAPVHDARTALPGEWIALTDGSAHADSPRWSPTGNLVYFISAQDGFRCIWSQRLDPRTRRPAGPPVPVQHFHSARRTLATDLQDTGLAVIRGRLLFTLSESTGNIWMAEPTPAPPPAKTAR